MDDALTIIDRGTGEIVIETRATIGDICQYYLGQNILHPIIILLIYVLFPLMPLLLFILFILHLFYRKLRITIRTTSCEIMVHSNLQIAGLEFFHVKQSKKYDYFKVHALSEYERRANSKKSTIALTIITGDDEKIRIWVNKYHYELKKLINKILSSDYSQKAPNSETALNKESDIENYYSPSIIASLSAINPASCSIFRQDNQLVVANKKSNNFITLGHLLGGIFLAGWGFWGITVYFASGLFDPRIPDNFAVVFGISLALLFITFFSVLMFGGVYIIVKRLIAAVIYQTVCFDNISQVITLEEQFPIYKSTQKYFWEKAELSIEKPRNAKEYLEDKKLLVLTLQKAGQPAKRVELFKHQNEQYLQQLRDYILEFYRESFNE